MRRILYNVSILTDKPTGVGIYTKELLAAINRQSGSVNSKAVGRKIANYPFRAVLRLAWNIFILPIRKRKNDVVFSFSSHGSPFIKNQIVTVHDLISLNYPDQHKFQYWYFKYIFPTILRSSRKIVAISEFTKAEILTHYQVSPSKIQVINNGANLMSRALAEQGSTEVKKITGNKPYYLTVGASYSHKNIDTLIEAIRLSRSEKTFVILGSNTEYFQGIRKLAEDLGLQNIIFLNYVSDAVLAGLYANAFCNLYPSLYEGFGFPPLEAANFDCPSIVSDIPIMHEIYNNSVLYVDSRSPEKLAGFIAELDQDDGKFTPVRAQFPNLLSKYSWDKAAKQTLELLNSLEND